MSSLSTCFGIITYSRPGMDSYGFLNTKPSLMSLRMFWRELALAISLISLGSNQTFFCPHFMTDAANRFCSFKELMLKRCRLFNRLYLQPSISTILEKGSLLFRL